MGERVPLLGRTTSANAPRPRLVISNSNKGVPINFAETLELPNSPVREAHLAGVAPVNGAFPVRISEFDVTVTLDCQTRPCPQTTVHVDNTYTTASGDILERACRQFSEMGLRGVTSELYDLFYNDHNMTKRRGDMLIYHNGVGRSRLFPGMEFILKKRIPEPRGVFNCVRSLFGYTCPRRGGSRRRVLSRKQKRSRRTRRN